MLTGQMLLSSAHPCKQRSLQMRRLIASGRAYAKRGRHHGLALPLPRPRLACTCPGTPWPETSPLPAPVALLLGGSSTEFGMAAIILLTTIFSSTRKALILTRMATWIVPYCRASYVLTCSASPRWPMHGSSPRLLPTSQLLGPGSDSTSASDSCGRARLALASLIGDEVDGA